ncbi:MULTISPECIES: LicD family protein [Clostridia]|uniref:LicD family protein n=1 Tax=Clostridia TaxID=186801 RepID=UPI000E46DB96|nr:MULTISPECIES: LicD family protein [Clostridia]RHV69951.1 LicD family protein [Roseburia sp. OM02-15]
MSDAVNLSGEQLRKLQLVELEMLQEVDRICRKNDIQYTLYAGTLLGAVRHKGFIPWDDDADIAFLPEEYEKFYQACKKDLNKEKFFLQDYRSDEYYRWGYAKLRRNNSSFIRTGQEHMKYHSGMCIDVFSLYSVPDNKIMRKLYYFMFFLIKKTLYSEAGKVNEKNAMIRLVYKILSKIPKGFVFSIAQKIICKKNTENVDLMYIANSPRCKYGIPRRCLVNSVDLEFEGTKFMSMSGYDEVLKMAYGDYMKLPPENQRESHNPASCIKFPDEMKKQG